MDALEDMAGSLNALKPTPVSKFSVKNLLKQVKAMEKEVQLLRGSVSARVKGSAQDDSDHHEERQVKKTSGSGKTGVYKARAGGVTPLSRVSSGVSTGEVRRSSSTTPVGTPRGSGAGRQSPRSAAPSPKSALGTPKSNTQAAAAGTPRSARSTASRSRAGTMA